MSSSQPLVAIGVLAYNRAEGLRKTLKALCNQYYDHLEIHVSDDCSTDPKVSEVIEEFGLRDKRIKFYQQKRNLGIIRNHQFLLSQMPIATKYMMWACDDDDWHPDYVKLCVEELETHPEAILCSTQNKWIENGVFCEMDHDEQTHTLGIDDPIIRYKKVLSNILWWNHTFYGVIRKSAFDELLLRNVFAFDIHFILSLSLLGSFIKVPKACFTKTIGGHGSNLKKNLSSVKVNNWLSIYFPRVQFSLHLINGIRSISTLSFYNKFKLSMAVTYTVGCKKMYSKSIKQKFLGIIERFNTGLKLMRVWFKINNLELARLVNGYNLPLSDLHYAKKESRLYSNKIGIVFCENSSLFEAYDELLWLKKEHGAVFEYNDDKEINLVNIKNVRFYLKEGYYSYLLNEIFIKETYSFDISVPSIVIDVGTNVGVSALYFAKKSNVKKVFGFEPFQETAKAARENFGLNPSLHTKIQLEEFGLSNIDESISVDYSFSASQLASINDTKYSISKKFDYKLTEIKVKRASKAMLPILNEYTAEQKILKIDTEGSEYTIVQELSDSQLLRAFSCIMLEWHRDGEQLLIEILKANDFEVFSVDQNYSTVYGDTGMIYALKSMRT